MESLSFHNTSRTLLSVTAENLKKTPLAFSIALQPLKCLHGQYGKVHTEIALLSCFPSCHRCVLQELVWVSHRLHQVFSVLCCCGSEVQRSISGGGWEEEGVWSRSSTQQFQHLWSSWCHAAGVCWGSSYVRTPTTLSANPTASQQRSRNQSSHKSYKSVICLLF